MVKVKGSVRRSQLITTYGVGAIVAFGEESFVVCGLDRWDIDEPDLHEPRLERELNVRGFALPPASDHGPDIPVLRFPEMQSCNGCHRLAEHSRFTSFDRHDCDVCGQPLVPSRFVVACERGHLDDFPYFLWVHKGATPSGGRHSLRIEAAGATASLRDIVVSCECGVPAVTLEGAFARSALQNVTKCKGRRPWIGGDPEKSALLPRTLQRGASNVWFPVVRSSISIPPWSEAAYKALNKHWDMLRFVGDDSLVAVITGMRLPEKTNYTVADMILAIKQRRESEASEGGIGDAPLKVQEFEAIVRGKEEEPHGGDFVCVPAMSIDATVRPWFDQVMVVKRLREVRVLESLTRILPPSPADLIDDDQTRRRAPIYLNHPGWLPAIEVIGEGVFLRVSDDMLTTWERRISVADRVAAIDANYRRRFESKGTKADRAITPRLVALHTLAHVLINQWSLDCGYPAASLRERLYVSTTMAGILIYTATSDSAGSLGGVVGQADPSKLAGSLTDALRRAAWCSSDPLCIEADAQGVDSLNLAACHACVLLPEVCCEEMNLLLDRGLLVGTPDQPADGLFAGLLGESDS